MRTLALIVLSLASISASAQVHLGGGGGYPRLVQLNDKSWLLGYDNGKIQVKKSLDKGKTWTNPVLASFHDDAICANVDFFQLPDNRVLCAYRTIGKHDKNPLLRGIFCSISEDNGASWKPYNTIVSNTEPGYDATAVKHALSQGYNVGFYEPFMGIIDGKITVMYADDFSPMIENVHGNPSLNYKCQQIVSKQLVGDKWINPTIVMDGATRKSVGGNERLSRDGMPVFATRSDGTAFLVFEGTYRDNPSTGNIRFEILIASSKDGKTWSSPKELFVPSGTGTKASAPFICIDGNDNAYISFQTDEDAFLHSKQTGDKASFFKCLFAGNIPTPIPDNIKDLVSPAQNPFNLKPGEVALWNCLADLDNEIFCLAAIHHLGFQLLRFPVPQKT